MPDTLFSWQVLTTLLGASTLTYLIVAYTKNSIDILFSRLKVNVPTDLYAVFVGAFVLLMAALATDMPKTWPTFVLALFNGFLVAATAGKMNDKVLQEDDKKIQREIGEGN